MQQPLSVVVSNLKYLMVFHSIPNQGSVMRVSTLIYDMHVPWEIESCADVYSNELTLPTPSPLCKIGTRSWELLPSNDQVIYHVHIILIYSSPWMRICWTLITVLHAESTSFWFCMQHQTRIYCRIWTFSHLYDLAFVQS